MTRHTTVNYLLLLSLAILWGSAFAIIKVALETIAPEWTVALRIVLATCVLLPAAWLAGQSLPRGRRHWAWIAALAVCGNIAPFYAVSWGQQHISSSLAGILMGFIPLATLLLAHIFVPGEKLTLARGTGFLLGFAGLLLIMGHDALSTIETSGIRLWAELAVLTGAFLYAANNIIARRAPSLPVLAKSASVALLSAAIAPPLAVISMPTPFADASPASLIAVLALGLFPTALATIIFFKLVEKAGPSFTSLTSYLVPVVALSIGIVMMGEQAAPEMLGGLALILCGIALSELSWRRRSRP